ncbi:MAG: hypothetical protein L0332_15145 [Chloroflexi bacterium]|nr:hypothetical protein [Chloroflexota bacterium]MCI0577748.1 hypothetical protein [Chloroflexota bacterium]MCI0644654.1 hypothetical protein [Chloroflexota bacterium]MCI0728038.1 hypothetical protein [Chloroflexota bacterium]
MRFLRSLLSNLATLLSALALALIIWAVAVRASDPVETQLLQIDVVEVGRPADAQLGNRLPETAQITIQGPSSALEDVSPADFTAVIDLSEVPFGESEVELQIQGGHERVEVVSKFPETVLVRLEQIVTRDIPVILETRGEAARGHRAGEERVEPGAIQVTGLASRVNQLAEARVVVSLDGAREDVSILRRPTFYDLQGNVASVVGLTVNPEEVEVIVPVEELAGFAEKPISVNWVGEPAQGYRLLNVNVEPNSIQVTGPPATLDSLRVETEPVDISGLTESATLPVTLDLPPGVSLVEGQPIIVTFEIEPILTSAVVRKKVDIRGLGEGLEAILDPEEISVFLFGPAPALESLEEEDVRATVDLLNLEVGTYSLEPIVSVAVNDVEFRSTQPAVISVEITESMTITNGLTETVLLLDTALAVSQGAGVGSDPAGAGAPVALRPRFALLPERQEPV